MRDGEDAGSRWPPEVVVVVAQVVGKGAGEGGPGSSRGGVGRPSTTVGPSAREDMYTQGPAHCGEAAGVDLPPGRRP